MMKKPLDGQKSHNEKPNTLFFFGLNREKEIIDAHQMDGSYPSQGNLVLVRI